jgi:integrase
VIVIPAERTKTRREHRVPLSAQAMACLDAVKPLRRKDGFIFPGDIEDWPITNMAMLMCLRRLKGKTQATVHGFRSSFRDWCADSGVPRELAEACLAHVAGGVERAYYRSDVIDLRRDLMQRWADHCLPPAGVGANVVPLVPR